MMHVSATALRAGLIELKGENDDPTAIVQKALNDLTKTIDDRLKEVDTKSITDRMDRIEARLNRPGAADDEVTAEQKAFDDWCRTGNITEIKALNASSNAGGGVLAPGDYEREIIKGITLFSPVRSIARVSSMSAGSITLPTRTGTIEAHWVTEVEDRSKTQPEYGSIELVPHELACYVDVSRTLLEDSAFNIESELSSDFAEQFGKKEGSAFVVGDGLKKPRGLITDPSIEVINSGHASGFPTSNPADALIDFFYGLPSVYAARGTWMMNRKTMGAVRKLKDTTGQYLWQGSLAAGEPPTLLGRPVLEAPDMPDIGANTTPIVFGDFASGLRIFDRVGLQILRDEYTMATKGIVRFHARRRVTSYVTKPEAFKILKIAA